MMGIAFGTTGAQIPIAVGGTLPASVNNAANAHFPPIVDQGMRESCANASGIGYVFNYEINEARNVSGDVAENQYPFFYTYDFLNDGSERKGTFRMFLDAWNIGRENGIVNARDFGPNDLYSTLWVSGYDHYFQIMQNRVDKIDSMDMTDSASLVKMKQWLYDHGNGSVDGGLWQFTAYIYGSQPIRISSGVEAGRAFFKAWGTNFDTTSRHAMAIIGYNDSIRVDLNGDGKFSNSLDISSHDGIINQKDGKIDMADWEIGALKVVNSWGLSWGDNGFAYAPYRSLFISYRNGGISSSNRLYHITVKKDYKPKMALQISLTDNRRNTIALSVGVSSVPSASVPSIIRSFDRQFTYAGGEFPMCGNNAPSSIEIGLDVSDLIDSIGGAASATFFLVVDSKAAGGVVDSLSLMDYTSGALVQTKSSQTNVVIAAGSSTAPKRTCIGVKWNPTGVAGSEDRIVAGQLLRIETKKGLTRISAPGKRIATIALVNAVGKRLGPIISSQWGEYAVCSGPDAPGVYFIEATLSDGRSMVGTVIRNR